MKLFFKAIILICFLSIKSSSAQCPPSAPTITIIGLYTANLNPIEGSIVYVTSSATITGNINLNNASLYNCGTILSQKINMKQSQDVNLYVFKNNNIIKCDSIFLDSLGHFDNNDTVICKQLRASNKSYVGNTYVIDAGKLIIETSSNLGSTADIKANYLELKDNNSNFYNAYGNIYVRKLFKTSIGTSLYGVLFICVDSCLINNGTISSSSASTWTPSIKITGISQNTGLINNVSFCDLSSTNGGMLDINTGTITNLTYCTSNQHYCDYSYVGVAKNNLKNKNITIYPNPFNDKLTLNTTTNELKKMVITNTLGQIVYQTEFYQNNITIDLPQLQSGAYIAQVYINGKFNYGSKLIKH